MVMAPTTVELSPPPPSISPLLIATVVLFSSSLLIAISYFLYSALSSSSPPRSSFDHSLDISNNHPAWSIATTGLHQSVIDSISVYNYKKGDRLMHGTACAVCLAEFEDGESLRTLPTCRHAFHVPCIDTWLASHTTCPICRAPVLPPTLSYQGARSIEIGDGLGLSSEVSVEDEGRPIRRAASMDRLGGKPIPSSCSSPTTSSSNSLAERSLS